MDNKIVMEGITFDDVLLIPAGSEVLPREVDTRTRLSRNIMLNIPLVSAAMDTVTEADLAIALAREGGIGIIHKNMSVARQASEVDKVKRSESGMIREPITLSPEHKISEAVKLMERYHISGIPIVKGEKLVGILTNRDLRFETNLDLQIEQVMTKEGLVTAPLGTTLEEAERILQKHKIEKLLVVDEQCRLRGLITVKDILKKKLYPQAAKDEHGRLLVGAAVGVAKDTERRVEALIAAGVDVIVVDTAHGHSKGVLDTVRLLKKKFPQLELIAGNAGTREGAEALINEGVDAVKVGIGPSAICTTRVVTGVGIPQITAIMECAEACGQHNIPLIADGGIKQTGDIAKAIAAGADTVMIGNLFAGTEESPGEIVFLEGRSYKVYRGMGSIAAMKEGSSDRYFQEGEVDLKKLVPEGIEGRVPFRGPLSDCVYQMIGGLRSAMGYCGVKTIPELKEKGRFIKITLAGLRESHPHDVIITKEAPNYKLVEA
ncbi:MAG: IMP dehydrogenase [candidate division KSB1 bacterium]|nr:IMP dehydrogenase [candidate division KSB1 bacterium]